MKSTVARPSRYLPWAILLLGLVLGWLTIPFGKFIDEADNLVVGSLIAQGKVLYRDVFSHHFPFTYYWTALAILLTGKSILGIRTLEWIFIVASLGVTIRFTRFPITLAIFSIVWGLIRNLYQGNLILYHVFSGIALTCIASLVLSRLLEEQRDSPQTQPADFMLGFWAAVAVLNDPFNIYPVAVAGILFGLKQPKAALRAALTGGGILLFYGLYLELTQSGDDFYRSAVVFNTTIYNKYLPVEISRFTDFYRNARSILGLIHWSNFDRSIIYPLSKNPDNWLFCGFILRLAVISETLFLLLREKFLPAAFVILSAITILSNSAEGMRMISFEMFAILMLLLLLTGEGLPPPVHRAEKGILTFGRIVLAGMFLWFIIQTVKFNISTYPDSAGAVSNLERNAEEIRSFSCNLPNVRLLDYPSGMYSYWFADEPPAAKYIFMFPWVAKVGQEEVIRSLADQRMAFVLVRIKDMKVWNTYPTTKYLADLILFLDQNYIKISEGVYRSPVLAQWCPVQ